LIDLDWQGLVEAEKLDSFNIPFYSPSMQELQSIMEAEKLFEIESMRVLSGFPLHPLLEVREGEEEMFGKIVGNFYRAVFENIVGTHLGSDEQMVDEIFKRIAKRAAAKYGEFLPNTLDVAVACLVSKRG
jgi:jasmonate O-methyltransferase